jgi:hypothetical protein
MAAARHVLLMCGSAEIDGHAFCSGLELLGIGSEDVTTQVTFLIRGAIFRSRNLSSKQGRLSLAICSLGEIVDKYHNYQATKRHDKVYALLGLCSDSTKGTGLDPDYSLPWECLMRHLVKFLFGDQVSITTWNNIETAVIKGKCHIIGQVVDVKDAPGGKQSVEIDLCTIERAVSNTAHWLLQTSAKSIQSGDVICLLQGCSKPTITRLCKDYFAVIIAAASPLKNPKTKQAQYSEFERSASFNHDPAYPEHVECAFSDFMESASFNYDISLIWDWKGFSEDSMNSYDTWRQSKNLPLNHEESRVKDVPDSITRRCEVVLILAYLGLVEQAEDCLHGLVEQHIGELYIDKQKDSILKELLETGRIGNGLMDKLDRGLLWFAAAKGHSTAAELLLESRGADIEVRDSYGQTPLCLAASSGHEATVKLLLEARADIEAKDSSGRTPLSLAASSGHEATVKLLLEARADTEARVKLLFEARADTEIKEVKDSSGRTPLCLAASSGHEAIVKLLLEARADTEAKGSSGRTPLSWAASSGRNAVASLLQSFRPR